MEIKSVIMQEAPPICLGEVASARGGRRRASPRADLEAEPPANLRKSLWPRARDQIEAAEGGFRDRQVVGCETAKWQAEGCLAGQHAHVICSGGSRQPGSADEHQQLGMEQSPFGGGAVSS